MSYPEDPQDDTITYVLIALAMLGVIYSVTHHGLPW